MRTSYHDAKRLRTLQERGLDFAQAGLVFEGPHLTVLDDRRDYGEDRFQTLGQLGEDIVMVVWTQRDDARHIISMRKCHAKERDRYFQQLG